VGNLLVGWYATRFLKWEGLGETPRSLNKQDIPQGLDQKSNMKQCQRLRVPTSRPHKDVVCGPRPWRSEESRRQQSKTTIGGRPPVEGSHPSKGAEKNTHYQCGQRCRADADESKWRGNFPKSWANWPLNRSHVVGKLSQVSIMTVGSWLTGKLGLPVKNLKK